MEFEKEKFAQTHCEAFGKSGCRRIVAGAYVAVDPTGRAIMLAALEKQRLVYVMNRDAGGRLTISSPLEANCPNAVLFDAVGLDVGFENPVFAALELAYVDDDPAAKARKMVTFYELDLGLNHMVKKSSLVTERSANKLVAIPGGGVLVCSEHWLEYFREGESAIRAVLPRRASTPDHRGVLVVSSAVHKQRNLFFVLLQSEYGDIYKVTFEEPSRKIKVQYFDTLPVSGSMCITKSGLLFAASEFGDHALYQFQSIGDGDPVISTAVDIKSQTEIVAPTFETRPLTNLELIDEMSSLAPCTSLAAANVANETSPQLYALCGRGSSSSIRVLRHGLEVTELAVTDLPGTPSAVWSVRTSPDDESDKYIVVSFVNATLVLSVGESVEEVTDSGFVGDVKTIGVVLTDDGAIVQVHSKGWKKWKPDARRPCVGEWTAPEGAEVKLAAANKRQVVLSLSGGDVAYFELQTDGQLKLQTQKNMGVTVSALALAEPPQGRQRFPFLALGGWDNTVRVVSLDPQKALAQISTQALPATASSLCLITVAGSLVLGAGLKNGVLVRTKVDAIAGTLSESRTRFLGARSVTCTPFTIEGNQGMLCHSTRSWLYYQYQGKTLMTPMSYQEELRGSCNFSSAQCPDAMVAVAGNSLRILALEHLGEVFNVQAHAVAHTPRKLIPHPQKAAIVVVEGDRDPISGAGKWSSLVRVYDAVNSKTLSLFELDADEMATSLCDCVFAGGDGEHFLAVGTVIGMKLHPRTHSGCRIRIFRYLDNGSLALLHVTDVEDVPRALHAMGGKLIAGVGTRVRVYELGKKRLLRKCEYPNLPTLVTFIDSMGERLYVGDAHESVHFLRYNAVDNVITLVADDFVGRMLTNAVVLDYDTVAGADKFGNVFVVRAPEGMDERGIVDSSAEDSLWSKTHLNGAANKLKHVCQYHVGEVVTSVCKTSLENDHADAVVFSTIMGRVGALVPFATRADVEFFPHLEMHMRQSLSNLVGRDHMQYRSYFAPVKQVIDGDLCELFAGLPTEKQKSIAGDLERDVSEILKKVERMRHRLM